MPVALISGVSGQDGSYLVDDLVSAGYEVHGLTRSRDPRDTGDLAADSRVTLHECDVARPEGIAHIVHSVQPDEVYSLAAISSVHESWQNPVLTGAVNGQGVVALLEALHEHERESGKSVRFVHASSAEIFGQAAHAPQNEQTPIAPTSPYGASKAYAHFSVGVFRARGMHASNCILYNHESPRRPAHFVTRKITMAVARIGRGLQDRLELGNLDARRDWGWAPDYVRAMRLAAQADAPNDYVIATGVSHSVSEFLDAAFARVGIADWSELVTQNPDFVRPVDPTEQRGDASRAREELGWQTTVDFETIVQRMVDHDLQLLDNQA